MEYLNIVIAGISGIGIPVLLFILNGIKQNQTEMWKEIKEIRKEQANMEACITGCKNFDISESAQTLLK